MEVGVSKSPGHSGRVRICIQTAFHGKTYVYMTRGKTASVSRFARQGTTTRVTLLLSPGSTQCHVIVNMCCGLFVVMGRSNYE